ncbi:hypothetical protein [Marispirochaeta sp.]|uniref:hypothetical protein n=1 Tax=Marispirochaeta sp. TaxID=2038653 RepID=UPI0029C67F49|nr:hypothetical protein [Marispirochaeta sp.]
MATDSVSRVIPFPTYSVSEGGQTEYPCPRRREVTEPEKILQFPHPILGERNRIRKEIEDLFITHSIDSLNHGKLLCYQNNGDSVRVLTKLNETDKSGRRRYEDRWFYDPSPPLFEKPYTIYSIALASRAEAIYYEYSDIWFDSFE